MSRENDERYKMYQSHLAGGGHVANCQCNTCQSARNDWKRLDDPGGEFQAKLNKILPRKQYSGPMRPDDLQRRLKLLQPGELERQLNSESKIKLPKEFDNRYHANTDSYPVHADEHGSEVVESIARVLLGETVVTNDRVLNHALTQAGNIIGRRDITPLDKFEMLAAYVLKTRREVLGKADE